MKWSAGAQSWAAAVHWPGLALPTHPDGDEQRKKQPVDNLPVEGKLADLCCTCFGCGCVGFATIVRWAVPQGFWSHCLATSQGIKDKRCNNIILDEYIYVFFWQSGVFKAEARRYCTRRHTGRERSLCMFGLSLGLLNHTERLFSDFHISMGWKWERLTDLRWPHEHTHRHSPKQASTLQRTSLHIMQTVFVRKKGFYFCLLSVKGWDLHINWPFYFSHCSPRSFYLICGHVNEFFQFGTMWDYLYSVFECILSVWAMAS